MRAKTRFMDKAARAEILKAVAEGKGQAKAQMILAEGLELAKSDSRQDKLAAVNMLMSLVAIPKALGDDVRAKRGEAMAKLPEGADSNALFDISTSEYDQWAGVVQAGGLNVWYPAAKVITELLEANTQAHDMVAKIVEDVEFQQVLEPETWQQGFEDYTRYPGYKREFNAAMPLYLKGDSVPAEDNV